MKVELDWDERQALADMVREYRDDVAGGRISGYGQSRENEIASAEALLAKLEVDD